MIPKRRVLVKQKNDLLTLVNGKLNEAEIFPLKLFARVKTIGSLDRKERYARSEFPDSFDEFVREDILGLTVVVNSENECYAVLEQLKRIGNFPSLKGRMNPRNYFRNPRNVKTTNVPLKDVITGNLSIQGYEQIHVIIAPNKSFQAMKAKRGLYKKAIKTKIKKTNQNK